MAFANARFVSDFATIEVAQHSQSLLAVTPTSPVVRRRRRRRALRRRRGTCSGSRTVVSTSATLNPDFGQVESDQLVGELQRHRPEPQRQARPFFTENQAFFRRPSVSLNNSNRLLYTRAGRRPADDGSGPARRPRRSGSTAAPAVFNYGVFAATRGRCGRPRFLPLGAARATSARASARCSPGSNTRSSTGYADVLEFDHRWTPNPNWRCTTLVGSDVRQLATTHRRHSGGQCWSITTTATRWRQQALRAAPGDGLQLNDFGHPERNDFNHLLPGRAPRRTCRRTGLPGASTRYAGFAPQQRPRRAHRRCVGDPTCSATAAMAATSSSKSASPLTTTTWSRAATAWSTCRVLPVFRAVHAAQGPLVDITGTRATPPKGSPARSSRRDAGLQPDRQRQPQLRHGEMRSTTRTPAAGAAGRFPYAGQGRRDLLGSYRANQLLFQRRHACSGSSARSRNCGSR